MKNSLAALICVLLLSGCGFLRSSDRGDAPPLAHSVVNAAYSQIGKKYRAGGKSPQTGFDCSGLVWWAYQKSGLTVPRRTVEQAKAGSAVSRGRERPGDIVVFRASHAVNGLHTGLYAGGDTFIHSPSSGSKIRTENINTPYWNNNLITVRRIVR
ncbi:MAG: C40 family peptidase [Desulfovibrio sp.]|jgi:cell wall-associated NlpC family hydrolase|nr:C40 family peptidase [Desulfovibrio sp.]